MIQKNHGHRPDNRPRTNPHAQMQNRADVKQCDCEADCKCACQDGKPCTCGCGCGCGCKSNASGIVCGIFSLIGACLICAAVLCAADRFEKAMTAVRPAPVARAAKTQAPAGNMDKVVADYIKNNPQAIIASLEAYDRQQRAKQVRTVDAGMLAEILSDKTNHVLGNPKGSFVMIEFFDYNCGYCKMMNKKMAEAVKKSDNIRWVLMDAPIFGEKSEIISRYAFAAAKQGKFAEYHAALGEENDKSEANLKAIGKKLGLDVAKLEKDAKSDAAKDKLAKTRTYTQKLGLSGVPMFIIDGKVQTGAFPDEQMDEYIKKANEMKKAKK
ncbi:MAG: DsbA family protein [Alphaproteobacteria bacterium]